MGVGPGGHPYTLWCVLVYSLKSALVVSGHRSQDNMYGRTHTLADGEIV